MFALYTVEYYSLTDSQTDLHCLLFADGEVCVDSGGGAASNANNKNNQELDDASNS